MKVKIVFKNADGVEDIRRFPNDTGDAFVLSNVIDFVESTYPRFREETFTLKYTDDEGDQVTIGSDVELNEAIRVAQADDRKSLKLFVVLETAPENEKDASETEAPPEEKKDVPPLPGHDQLRNLFAEFMSDTNVQQSLPAALEVALGALQDGAELNSALDLAFEAAPVVAESKLVQAVRPHLKTLCARAQPLVPALIAIGPQVLPSLLPNILQLGSCLSASQGVCGNDFPFGNLGNLMTMFGGGAPASAATSAAADDSSDSESDSDDDDDDNDDEEAHQNDAPVVHERYSCDECEVHPIIGVRYHCLRCTNYDLCENCESKGTHPKNHPMEKIKVANGSNFGHQSWRHLRGRCANPWRRGGCGRGSRGRRFCGNPAAAAILRAHGRHVARAGERTGRPRADFVSDVTIPDRSVVLPNQTLVKTWRIKNSGQVSWPEGSTIAFIKGDDRLVRESSFPVKPAAPGEEAEVSVVLRTPAGPGRYVAYFRLRTPHTNSANGRHFGQRVWVDFDVAAEEQASTEQPSTSDASNSEPELKNDAPPASAPAEPPIEADEAKYSTQLSLLDSMGFKSRAVNLYLLKENDGNLQTVVQTLLNRQA